jgi:hypothetical protein
MTNVSINELKGKYPNEPIDLALENLQARMSLNISPQGDYVQVAALIWGAQGIIANGQLSNAQGNNQWKLEELAQAFGISLDDPVWVMNDRI